MSGKLLYNSIEKCFKKKEERKSILFCAFSKDPPPQKKKAERGLDGFLEVENRVNAQLSERESVIAPGGSVIYGKEAMENLKSQGVVVYLKISFEELTRRLGNVVDRGVVLREGMTLRDLYEERIAYFEKYADVTIDEEGKDFGEVVDELRGLMEARGFGAAAGSS